MQRALRVWIILRVGTYIFYLFECNLIHWPQRVVEMCPKRIIIIRSNLSLPFGYNYYLSALPSFSMAFFFIVNTSVDFSRPIVVQEGRHVRLRCPATGFPKPHVEWRRMDLQTTRNGAYDGIYIHNLLHFICNAIPLYFFILNLLNSVILSSWFICPSTFVYWHFARSPLILNLVGAFTIFLIPLERILIWEFFLNTYKTITKRSTASVAALWRAV